MKSSQTAFDLFSCQIDFGSKLDLPSTITRIDDEVRHQFGNLDSPNLALHRPMGFNPSTQILQSSI